MTQVALPMLWSRRYGAGDRDASGMCCSLMRPTPSPSFLGGARYDQASSVRFTQTGGYSGLAQHLRDPPRCGQPRARRLLPRRVHLPVQPPDLPISWEALGAGADVLDQPAIGDGFPDNGLLQHPKGIPVSSVLGLSSHKPLETRARNGFLPSCSIQRHE